MVNAATAFELPRNPGWGISSNLISSIDVSGIYVRLVKKGRDFRKAINIRYLGYKKYFSSPIDIIDEYDLNPNCESLLAVDKRNQPIGSMRIMDGGRGPVELCEFLNPRDFINDFEMPFAEATRLSVPKHRHSLAVKMLLCKAFYLYCSSRGIRTMLISARPLVARLYKYMLFQDVGELGVYYHDKLKGKEHRTYKLHVDAVEPDMYEMNHPFYKFLFLEDHLNINIV